VGVVLAAKEYLAPRPRASMTHHLAGLVEALERGGSTHAVEDVLREIEKGEAQLWEADGALIVTEIHDTPRKRLLHFWIATGELEPVIALSHRALEWAKEQGCTQATLAGRKGWEKALASEGWSPTLILMSREV
jgi:hypothetical protein